MRNGQFGRHTPHRRPTRRADIRVRVHDRQQLVRDVLRVARHADKHSPGRHRRRRTALRIRLRHCCCGCGHGVGVGKRETPRRRGGEHTRACCVRGSRVRRRLSLRKYRLLLLLLLLRCSEFMRRAWRVLWRFAPIGTEVLRLRLCVGLCRLRCVAILWLCRGGQRDGVWVLARAAGHRNRRLRRAIRRHAILRILRARLLSAATSSQILVNEDDGENVRFGKVRNRRRIEKAHIIMQQPLHGNSRNHTDTNELTRFGI